MNKKKRQRVKSLHGQKPKGRIRRAKKKRSNAAYPVFAFPPGFPAKVPPLDPASMGPLVDTCLGMMFVEALKKTRLRDAVLKILFPETPETPVNPKEGE